MIRGVHVLLYSEDADADRLFLRDVLSFPAIDAGGGWLIMKLPPAEIAVHPADAGATPGAALYLMCDDVEAVVAALEARKVVCALRATERWGIRTTITLPSGLEIGLYQPRHALAFDLPSA